METLKQIKIQSRIETNPRVAALGGSASDEVRIKLVNMTNNNAIATTPSSI